MGDLSPHFSRHEIVCHHCHAGAATPQLLAILEELRRISGAPLQVVSSFRCKPHNTDVGGAPNSRHLSGDAADLKPRTYSVHQAIQAGALGIGTLDGWVVHVDWRPGKGAQWSYDR